MWRQQPQTMELKTTSGIQSTVFGNARLEEKNEISAQ
jgi:hypothetical protein